MSWDLVADFGADPSGVADSTTNLQNAFNTIGSDTFGGKLTVPKGAYKITAQTAYSSSKPLWIAGEGQQASQIRMASSSSSLAYIDITQGASFGDENGAKGTIRLSDLGFYNDVNAPNFGDNNIAVYLSGVNHGDLTNCGVYLGAATQRVNQGFVLNGCNQFAIRNCEIWATVNAIYYEGYCQVCTIEDVHIWTPSNSGIGTAAAVLYRGQTLGCSMRHAILHDGDRGIYWTQDINGEQPHLFEAYDVEFNNHTIAAFQMDYGLHATLTGCLWSGSAPDVAVPGLLIGANYTGDVTLTGCEFIGMSGHSVQINGGTGYTFDGCNFGGSGSYKYAANTYDEINVPSGAGVNYVSVNDCHFNVNPNLGVGTSMPPRYAINGNGAGLAQTDNMFAANSLYGAGTPLH